MPKNKLQKTLHDYLTKIKHPPHPQIHLPRILSGCKHPKTPSFALDGRNRSSDHAVNNNNNNKKDDAATLADVDRFLFENFKSLYFKDDDETQTNNNKSKNKNKNNNRRISEDKNNNNDDDDDDDDEPPKLASLLFDSPRFLMETPPDLCNATRFFVKPGNSGSLMEDSVSTLTNTSDEGESSNSNSSSLSPVANHNQEHRALPDNCVALLRYSPTPYDDFRRSMQDVVESKYGNINNIKNNNNYDHIDWDFVEDLLFCYLNLNEKKSHKFILSAFVDLITLMRRNSETSLPKGPCSVRTVRIDREVSEKKKMKNLKKKTKQLTIEFESP